MFDTIFNWRQVEW